MNDSEIKKLYTALLGKGYSTNDLGDEATFRTKMSDKTNRKQLYDWVSSKGNFRIGDYESYESRLTSTAQPTTETTAPTREEQLWQPTEQEKADITDGINRMIQNVEAQTQSFNKRMDNMQEYGLNPGLQTKEGKIQFNPESGKMEKTYLTPTGNRYHNKAVADMESFHFRQAADMSVSGQLRKARRRLQDLYAQREQRASEVYEEWEKDTKENTAPLAFVLAADTYVPRQQSDKENRALSVAIRQTEEQIKTLQEELDRNNGIDVGFWRGFGRTVGDIRTWDFGMGDMLDAMTMMNADGLKSDTATEGEKKAHDAMMGAIYEKEQTDATYGGNASFWNRAGVMTGYMPSFMLDFALTGGGFDGLNAISKGSAKLATKAVGEEVVRNMAKQGFKTYVKNNGIKGLGHEATNWTIKALGTTADDLIVRAPLMTNTVQMGKTTADIIDRKLGDVIIDENGNYDFSNDKTWGNAIWQGEANAIIENYSEMFGSHLDPVISLGNISKLANVIGAKRLGNVLAKADAGALSGIMGKTNEMFNKMGVSDYFGEVSEEYYGQLWRTMLNLDDAYQQNPDGTRINLFATGQFHGDIWGGMALSMGLMGIGKHTLSAANYASMKHGVNKADIKANELLGTDIWQPLKATLDLTTNENIGDIADLIANDKEFTNEEKRAILNYVERSLYLRGYNLGNMAQSRSEEQSEEEMQANESYLDGYNIASSQEMNDAKNLYDYHRRQVVDFVSDDMFSMIDENPVEALEFISNNESWSDEEREKVLDYINAKQVYDGMIQRVRDDIDGRIEQSNSMIAARINHSTGKIQSATMKQDDRKVYILRGNLASYTNRTGIDLSKSDESIIIRDAETGILEQVSPDTVLSIDEEQDPYEQQEIAAQVIREQFAQEAADKIDGIVTFNPGDTYTITGEDGTQSQVQIVANENGFVDNGDGTVNVSDGVNIFPLSKDFIQEQADSNNIARVAEFETQRAEENATKKQEAQRSQYALNYLVTLRNENGNTVRGNITSDVDTDGRYEVYTESPVNGKHVNLFTHDELDSMVESISDENGNIMWQRQSEEYFPHEHMGNAQEGNNGAENIPRNDNNAPQNIPAMQRIPKDEQGNPIYEQTDSDTAWDAIVEQTEGDEVMAQTVVDGMVADKEAALKKIEKSKAKEGVSIAEKIAAEKERKAAIEQAKQQVEIWKKIAGTANRRKMAVEIERSRAEAEASALRKAEEEKIRMEQEEAERIEREALNGVPDMADDTPQNARARGYRRVSGHKIDRQQPLQPLQGKKVAIKFSNDVISHGRVAIIEANLLQPSHIQGMRNPANFIDEAQPKERNDEASVLSARKIAGSIRPEEITSSITAYTGAPTVNARGEAIQGNNRSDALRIMWENHPEQAALYKHYLKDHAEEFGLQAEDIEAMKHPVLVNMVDVDDTEAIRLGQYVAQDTESGGTERIKAKNALQKMGLEIRSFANMLLKSTDDDTSFAGLIDNNATEVLKWMNHRGFISHTQYKSAFDSKGNISAEAKNDLRSIMYQSIFRNGNIRLEEMFNALPVKAQRAILATAFRDYNSPNTDRMIEEIQNSIRAYNALSQDTSFMSAKNFKETRMAVESWKRQYAMDDVTGESYLPAEKFSNFALHLATMYKGESQGFIQSTFNQLYDLIQGVQEENLFERPDNTPRTLIQAIKETLKIDNYGQQRNNVLAGNNTANQQGEQRSNRNFTSRERVEIGDGTTNNTGGTESGSSQSEINESEAETTLSSRIEVLDDDWEEGSPKTPTYKRSIVIDGKYLVIQVDEPTKKGDYTGSYFEYDGKRFGAIPEVIAYIDSTPSLADKVAEAEKQVNTNPTDSQKEAGNYKKGHVQVGTFDVTIENPKGSVRSGVDANGKEWSITMNNTYGYIRGTKGVDGDHIDVFLSDDIDGWNGTRVFIIDQYNPDGTFDEHKVMLGFNEQEEAEAAFLSNYDKEWAVNRRLDDSSVLIEDFEKWIASSQRKTKPFSEYKGVKNAETSTVVSGTNRLQEIKTRIAELKPLQQEAHTKSDIFEEARIISEINDLFAEQRKLEKEDVSRMETTPLTSTEEYTITPAQYTTKRGKVLDMHLVKFGKSLTKEQQRAAKELAKSEKGWYDAKQRGFMMRSEDSAKQLVDTILNNENAVSDAQPVSLADTRRIIEPQQVNEESLIGELNEKGEANLSDHIEQLTNPSGNRLVTDERYAELRERMRKKLGEQMNIGIDPEILAIGTEMAVYHLEKGARKFTEYAKAMIADLGDAIRPYIKAFYNGARNLPEIENSEIAADMTPYDEVQQFNVATFGKEHSDPFTTAEIVVAEQAHQEEAEQAKQEIINQRNTERRKENEQTSANTEAITSQAEVVASKAESDIEATTKEKQLNDVVATIDKQIEEVNKQLALLGYYEADIDDSQFHESYGYMRSAEKKAVKDANALAKRIVKDLGIDSTTIVDKKGKKRKVIAQANIAPAGGNVSIRLPLTSNRELYINADLEPDYKGGKRDNLYIDHIFLRIENPTENGERYIGHNVWVQSDATYTDMMDEIRAEIIQHVPEFDLPAKQSVSKTEQKQEKPKKSKKKAVTLQQSDELSLFDGLFDNETNNEDGLQRNDATRSAGVSADSNRHEQGLSKGIEKNSGSEQENSQRADDGGERTGNADDRTVRPRLSNSLDEHSIEGKHKKEVEQNRKLADELKGVTLRIYDKFGGEHEITDIVYYELANVFYCNDNINGSFQATRKELDNILKVARKSNNKTETFEPKNTHNNHSERGKDYAPTSVDSRIEANINAIELAQQLIENGEKATEKQMAVLRKFSGWGGLGKAFNEGTYYAPNNTSKRLLELLGEEAYQQAVMSVNSAFYTPAYIADTLWDIAEQMGFKGGNILEGSAGIGNILGQMPTHISERSDIHAIEIDSTSGSILSLLYPDANVEIQGFEQTHIVNGSVDLAITNVPFVTGLRVNDTTGDKDLSKKFHNIHDFCIAKNVRKLREGGLGIFITSNGTLDNSKKLRDWIVNEGGSDFIGAFRMHNKTFIGTGVTSDIIVIRKRVNGQKSANAIDVSTVTGERMAEYDTGETRKIKGEETPIIKQLSMDYNRYFIEHPENMAGEMYFAFEKGDTFRPTSKGLYPKQDKKQESMLTAFVNSFKEEAVGEKNADNSTSDFTADTSADGKKLGELYIKDGKLVIASFGGYYPLEVNANKVKGHTKVECFNAYKAIKEALAKVLSYQTEHESDEGLKPLLTTLNKVYDDFVNTYGHFTKNTAIAFLRNDVDYANVFSLEKYEETADEKGNRIQKFSKTDVFSKRVIEKDTEPTPTNVKDGIIASMFKYGRIDIPYIAEQLGENIESIKQEIIENNYGFEDPVTCQIEVSYLYLSGNVREKLRQAQENNENGKFDRNIKALQEVMPMDIPAHLIDFTLGSSWIDPKLYEEYVKERTDIEVRFTAVGGTWFMKAPGEWQTNNEKNRSMGIVSEMLHKTIMGHTLIEAAIQNKSITVSQTSKKWDGTTETITDKEATQACATKIDEIRQDFKEWARQKMQSDIEMSVVMERVYNDMFNNYVPMSIPDEFVPEYFGGASHKIKMRAHQGRAIVRGTMQPLLLAHEVGTGKTFTLISTAMEMRRLRTAHKPMIVVQNATVGQFVASAKELYPNAKILTLEETDRSAKGRKYFYAKIRYNDWDMIVVPQSTFEFIPGSEERQMTFIQDKIEEKMLVLDKMKEADPNGNNMITRQAEREIELLEAELAGLSDEASKKRSVTDEKKRAVSLQNAEVKAMEMLDRKTDDVENFDDMGIDALLVDEAHEYKHLGFATAMQRGVKGVDPSYSKKSQGVFLKTQAILEKNNGRNVIFATGTPISNTAAEIWTFMRYLMPADTMKEYGIYYFDDFVRNFGNIQQMLEFTTSGKFKENNRFAGYVNLPELVRIWSGISDTVLTKEAGGVSDKIPEMEGGKAQDLYLPQTRALRSIMKFVKGELETYDKMSGKEKKENSHIPLTMYGIAKAAAVDARLVQEDAEDDPHSKTNEAVRQTLRSLKETADYKGTVAIFADNYQNKHSGFNLYEDIREKLIAKGVPANEIVIMKSGMSVKKKLEIFEKVNRGEIRVILGSTFTLGTGVNIQERLHTLIHLDAPNRPMDYTQRNGRILRQGNLHKVMGKPVRILRFGVEDSLDVTAYQRLKTKGAIADSIMNGKQMMQNSMTNRVLEEEEDVFGDTVAQLSGSEYAMLKNNAEKNMRKYASYKKQWEVDQTYIYNAKPRLKALITDAEKRIEKYNKYLQDVRTVFPDGKFKEIVTGKHHFTSVDEMADFFKTYNKSVQADVKMMKDKKISGEQTRELTISIGDFSFKIRTVLNREIIYNGGNLSSEVHRKMTYSCPELGIEDVPVYQSLLRNAIEDIVKNVITGKDFTEHIEAAERSIKHNKAEMKQLLSREGKPFEYTKELEEAQAQYEEYSELMRKELEEKEAKYAEIDADIEEVSNLTNAEEDDDILYRSDDTMYRIREEAAPQNIGIGYKVFVLKNGELYPPMVANPNGDATPVGIWLDADAAPIAGQSKTGRNQVKAGGKGTQGGSGKLAYRPGWHLGVIPYALQFNRNDENGEKTLFPANFVWAEVEYANDVDYQEEAMSYGYNQNGKFQHSYAGLPRVPENGSYSYRTNPNPETDPWIITGAMRIKRLLTPTEVDEMVRAAGRKPQRRQDGAVTDDEITILNEEIAQNYRDGTGAYTDDEISFENDPISKMLGKTRRTKKQRSFFAERERKRMVDRVETLAKKLHLENVEIVTDRNILEGKKSKAKGFYSKSSGKITIVIPNHANTFDVEQTLLHEAVAHYGLRQLFGEHFDTFLDNVFNNADETIRKRIVDMAAKNGWDFHKATEEYLASLAENTNFENVNASWWRQIKNFFLNMLHKIGFEDFREVTLTDNELRYILWRSYENLAEPGKYRSIFGEAMDIAKQYELKVGNYAITNLSPVAAAERNNTLYRNGDPKMYERVLARDRYEQRVRSGMYQTQEALQDSMLGLKEAMNAILGQNKDIEDVDGFENAYLGENRLSSVNKAEADAFAQTLFKPMLDEVAQLSHNEMEREELTDYMMAKHGLERNLLMAENAAKAAIAAGDTRPLSDIISEFREQDFAGLTALTGMDNVADAEAEAQQIVDDYEQAHETTNLWTKVNAISKAILQKSYECGMISKATFDKVSNMYKYYIPLRGFDEKTSAEAYAYLSHRESAFNAPIKTAHGRRSKADDPFANLQSMAESAIMQGNRNKLVKQRFLNFVLNHPSDLVGVSDLWVEYDVVTDEWKPVFPDNIDSTDTPEEVEQKMQDFEMKMQGLAQQYPDQYKRGKDTENIPYRVIESRDMRQHQVIVKRGGRDYVITINGNPRAAQALNGQTNPDNDTSGAIGAILRAGERINRHLSAFYTTRNPDFVVSNFMRDMLYTNSMVWIKESPNYALRFHRNFNKANPFMMKQLLAKHRNNNLDISNPIETMFYQFMMNGGETGYVNIRDIEHHKNDIRRELKKANGKLKIARAWSLLGERLDEFNRAVENCARFAAFMTSREMGRTIDRAIYDAKEISVNFNKKGSGAKFYDTSGQTKIGNASSLISGLGRSGYVFWNAAIQGATNFGRQMKRHPAKAFTGMAAMYLLGAIVAYLGGSDDDGEDDKNAYYNLPEYVRRSNILFRAGDSWVSIPLPVEYRAIYGMGELMTSTLSGKEHLSDGELASAIAGQITQILPIDFLEGGGGLNAFIPSPAKPLWEAYVVEKSWTGLPLYKDTPYNKNMPEWTKAYKSANKYLVGLANVINETTGGDAYTKGVIDINPAKVEYLLNGYFGGVFGTIDKMSKTVETIAGAREYDPRSILLLNRLVKAGDERTEYRAINNEYFRLKEEHDRIKKRLKHYEEDTDNGIFDYAEKIDFLYNSPEYERYEIFESYSRDIAALYDELKETVDEEEYKNIETELNEVKKEMIDEMNQTRKRK